MTASGDSILPRPLALVIADTVIEDTRTRKKSIIGIFNSICSHRFPFRHPEMNVFVSLTDGHGLYESSLVCARSFDEKRIFESSGEVKFRSPNAVVEIHFALRNIAFPEPGKYTFQFYCNGSLLVMRPLEILKVKP